MQLFLLDKILYNFECNACECPELGCLCLTGFVCKQNYLLILKLINE